MRIFFFPNSFNSSRLFYFQTLPRCCHARVPVFFFFVFSAIDDDYIDDDYIDDEAVLAAKSNRKKNFSNFFNVFGGNFSSKTAQCFPLVVCEDKIRKDKN